MSKIDPYDSPDSGGRPHMKTERDVEPEMLLADGFEKAFIGVAHRYGFPIPIAAYNREKCIEVLLEDGCSRDEAEEYFEYNVIGAWLGEGTPLFIEAMSLEEAEERAND